ncbi:hypothetical protein LZ187_20925 [Rhodovulum sulfidophilum]|nr:hypothetical protein [Rhodovulum sulfidophilum]MCE8442199.1 hypothetical protein [Rhodovulum sulfidophilum]
MILAFILRIEFEPKWRSNTQPSLQIFRRQFIDEVFQRVYFRSDLKLRSVETHRARNIIIPTFRDLISMKRCGNLKKAAVLQKQGKVAVPQAVQVFLEIQIQRSPIFSGLNWGPFD